MALDVVLLAVTKSSPLDTAAYNAALVALSGSWQAAAQLLSSMSRHVRCDRITASMLIGAFNSGTAWRWSLQTLLGLQPSSSRIASLPWRVALQQLDKLAFRDVATYSILMRSLSQISEWSLALMFFDNMSVVSAPRMHLAE